MHTRPTHHDSGDESAKTAHLLISTIIAAIIYLAPIYLPASLVSGLLVDTSTVPGLETYPATHKFFNSVIPFTIDPWSNLFFGDSQTPFMTWSFYWAILAVSILIGSNPLAGMLIAAIVISLFGIDRTLLGIFSWIPLIYMAIQRFLKLGELPVLVILIFLGMRLSYSAGLLAPISLLICLVAVIVKSVDDRNVSRATYGFAALLIGILVTARGIPSLPSFDYPTSHPLPTLVPSDGVPGLLQPLIGAFYPLAVIDINSTRSFLLLPFIFATILTVRFNRSLISLTLLGIIAIDIFVGGQTSAIAPIASLERVIPGAFLYPLSAVLIVSLLVNSCHRLPLLKLAGFGILGLFLTFIFRNSLSLAIIPAIPPGDITKLASPSFAVFRNYRINSESYAASLDESVDQKSTWSTCHAKLSANINNSKAPNSPDMNILTDGDPDTRLSLGQNKGSSLQLCFDGTMPSALWLDVGNFKTDFPQAFTVEGLSNLATLSQNNQTNPKIMSFSPWLGPILFTPKQKLPYYGSQSNVFVSTASLRSDITCLKISLTESNAPFDWSIAELRCAV